MANVCDSQRVSPALRMELTSPSNFDNVNLALARICCQSNKDSELIGSILDYFRKLMEFNPEFTSLILQSLDLQAFIKQNLLMGSEKLIQSAVEFLKSF